MYTIDTSNIYDLTKGNNTMKWFQVNDETTINVEHVSLYHLRRKEITPELSLGDIYDWEMEVVIDGGSYLIVDLHDMSDFLSRMDCSSLHDGISRAIQYYDRKAINDKAS